MRGYVATVLGGLAAFLAAYVSGGRLLALMLPEEGARICASADDPYVCNVALLILGLAAVLVDVVVASALASAVVLRLLRDSAAVETSIAVAPIAALGMGLMVVATSKQDSALSSSWLAVPVVLCIGACLLAAARWLGVAWHRRRTARASGDA